MINKKWEIIGKSKIKSQKSKISDIIDILLRNRGLITKRQSEEFFNPTPPDKITVKSLSLSKKEIEKAILRIKKARDKNEKVIVFGDYDADGVCATAILWECLYELGLDVSPYIPERFSEGYGLKAESLQKLKTQNKAKLKTSSAKLKLIITVDNGIVASDAVKVANQLGIDVIVTDHHQKGKRLPKAHAIIHTDKIGGSGIAWILAREIKKKVKSPRTRQAKRGGQTSKVKSYNGLELAAIGTIADQLPLIGPNRSFAKYGLEALNKTKRPGLIALFEEAAIKPGSIGTYEINFIIAPRINAMGRMTHAIDSLRLLCTRSITKAQDLAQLLGKTNSERQRIVAEVVAHARVEAEKGKWEGIMILHHESYHEGVIGLAASRLVEEFWRPAIVISRGVTYSKASARSIPGFNIIAAIRELDDMLLDGGGHPMAAGFTIATSKLKNFIQKLDKVSASLLTDDLLTKKLKVDLELNFNLLNWELVNSIKIFEPTGIGNPTPTFVSREVSPLDARVVGRDRKHLKLKLRHEDQIFSAIAFGFGEFYAKLSPENTVDIVYWLEENIWNGNRNIELKIKDIKIDESHEKS